MICTVQSGHKHCFAENSEMLCPCQGTAQYGSPANFEADAVTSEPNMKTTCGSMSCAAVNPTLGTRCGSMGPSGYQVRGSYRLSQPFHDRVQLSRSWS